MDIQVVQRALTYRAIVRGERRGPQMVVFLYATNQPWAVHLSFPRTAWTFSRELLAEGITVGAGEMDVVVQPVEDGVEITLSSPDGLAVLWFDRDDLIDALQETWRLVAAGAEGDHFDIDAEIALLPGVAS